MRISDWSSDVCSSDLDRFLEHRLIEFEADLADMPRLFVADEVARAANVEVVARELEPRAQCVEIAEQLEPLLRGIGDRATLERGEIGVSARLRPPERKSTRLNSSH